MGKKITWEGLAQALASALLQTGIIYSPTGVPPNCIVELARKHVRNPGLVVDMVLASPQFLQHLGPNRFADGLHEAVKALLPEIKP